MKSITSEWYSVEDCMPPNDGDWRIVRTINKDECADFYFMAYYSHEDFRWSYFDEDEIESREKTMQVTHWCNVPQVAEVIKFSHSS